MGLSDLSLELKRPAAKPVAPRQPDKSYTVMFGEGPGSRRVIDGHIRGGHRPFDVRQGERAEMTFMNPTSMMHPMHLHGRHFSVVGIGGQRFSGPVGDTVIVPAHAPVTIAFDAGQKRPWFLHCHLCHMTLGRAAYRGEGA